VWIAEADRPSLPGPDRVRAGRVPRFFRQSIPRSVGLSHRGATLPNSPLPPLPSGRPPAPNPPNPKPIQG
jgi:hypothetical protein